MTEILLGPTLTAGPTTKVRDRESGKTYYKKRILPEGAYKYKTQDGKDVNLDLSAQQLGTFVKSFKDKAYDEVPFQFGAHSNDPTIRKGTLVQVEHVPGKGLDGYFELDESAASYIEKYPNFGVSPRLVLDINRSDGKKFDGAIQHVAGTVVPRMTGMGPWSKVELSEDGDTNAETPVIDLSTEIIEVPREGKIVTTPENNNEGGDPKVFTLSEDEYKFFQQQMKDYKEIMEEGSPATASTSTTPPVDLSEITGKADQALSAVAALQRKAIEDGWKAQRALLAQQGVPPSALDLAEPVMTDMEPRVYDLESPEGIVKVDAKTQMLGILETLKGTVDLSGERGHGVGGTQSESDSQFDVDAWIQNNL